MKFSKHLQVRMSQRAITMEMVEFLIKYGTAQYHQGSKIVSLNRKALQKVQSLNIS